VWKEPVFPLLVGVVLLVAAGVLLLVNVGWGLAALFWFGIVLGVVLTLLGLLRALRSYSSGELRTVWAGQVVAAIAWGGLVISLTSGVALIFMDGPGAGLWLTVVGGIGFALLLIVGMWLQTRGPLPALDRRPRPARVVANTDDGEGMQILRVRYVAANGVEYEADLADLIDDTWVGSFELGTIWQVYAFADLRYAEAVVFLTELHDDVWRSGYKFHGVRFSGESGPVPRGPGSPFLYANSRWTFADEPPRG
jgi:hypothetical protein